MGEEPHHFRSSRFSRTRSQKPRASDALTRSILRRSRSFTCVISSRPACAVKLSPYRAPICAISTPNTQNRLSFSLFAISANASKNRRTSWSSSPQDMCPHLYVSRMIRRGPEVFAPRVHRWLAGKALALGDHLKTGHTLSVQNRPTGLAEDVIVLPCRSVCMQGEV